MSIPGLDSEQNSLNLTVRVYGMMNRSEIPILSILTDDRHLQEMMFCYGKGLEFGGYNELEIRWMDCVVKVKYSDEILRNAGIAIMQFGSDVDLLRSNTMAKIMM